ncbi:hypothetical protein Goklo_015874, partial [Gossypium klotzschianum]|nr:hypothetical protein [Gossypium klotzschianum]
EYTITLKDVALQIGLTVDGPVITGSAIVLGKVTLYQSLLGKALKKFEGERETELGVCCIIYLILGDVSGHATKCGINRWLFALAAVVGLVVTIISTWNYGPSYLSLPKDLEDIRLLLDQRSEAEFEWMSYANTDVISCIPLKVLRNRQMWDAKVPLIVYTMMEMHKTESVLRQFEWRQRISLPSQDLKELYNVGMR